MTEVSIETLITTVEMEDAFSLLTSMNIQTPFIIGNQSNTNCDTEISFRCNAGIVLSRCERGVGRNRNLLIERSCADICVLADDDLRFVDNYKEIVKRVFREHQNADVIVFNLYGENSRRRNNEYCKSVKLFNYMNYGAARIAFRRNSVCTYGLRFNECFGGGSRYQCGEDSLFIREALRHGLRVVAVPDCIAGLTDCRDSTWFNGYTTTYLHDKGVFLRIAHPRLARTFALYLSMRHKEYQADGMNCFGVFRAIEEGIRYIDERRYLSEK